MEKVNVAEYTKSSWGTEITKNMLQYEGFLILRVIILLPFLDAL